MRVDVEPSNFGLERRVGTRLVTTCHNPTRWAQRALATDRHPPSPSPTILGVGSSDALEPVGGASRRYCGRFSQSGRRCTVRSPLPPTAVSSALALLLVTTFVLARKTLLPPVRPAGHGNSPMRRLSLGPAPSYRSSSNNTNTVPLPPTPPITPSSVIPFVTPSSRSLFIDCSTGRSFA